MRINPTLGNADYCLIRNSETGDESVVDLKMGRFKKVMNGFLNSLKMSPRFIKHIVLSQKVESYKPGILDNFMCCLRRYYGDVVYLWTVEVQEERLVKYGEAVLHWHILVAFEWGIDFGKDDVLRLQKYWKYGRCDVIPVKRVWPGYLLKYITKALNSPVECVYKLRRIGSSRIVAWLKQSWKRIMEAYEFFKNTGCKDGLDSLNDFYWSNGNAYLIREEDFLGVKLKERITVYRKRRYGWYRVIAYEGEAF